MQYFEMQNIENNTMEALKMEGIIFLCKKFLDDDKLRMLLKICGYQKIKSLIYLKMLNFHTLDGIIVLNWNEQIEKKVVSFFMSKGVSQVVVRTDAKYEVGPAPRGGYLVRLSEIKDEVKNYLDMKRIVILLEPRNRYNNLYGINILFDRELFPRNIYLEVVGPGFDISDISRGDITPHERIMLPRRDFQEEDELFPNEVYREIISLDHYRETVRHRLIKISRMVYPNTLKGSYEEEKLIRLAEKYLLETRNTLLLEHKNQYKPIPFKYLKEVYYKVKSLPLRLPQIAPEIKEPFVVSLSIFNETEEMIFWDIQSPHLKYNIREGVI